MPRFFSTRVLLFALVAAVAVAVPQLAAQGAKEPGTVVLKGNPMGGVKFDHKLHTERAGKKCETCHHASKPEKPSKIATQKCQDCHTKTAAAPMKTAARGAFHDPMAKKGTCIDCHAGAKDKKAPLKCNECHKKENT